MHEFDSYINTIVGGLRVNKNKRDELAEEFKDHLDLLKSESVKNGFAEEDSMKRAIAQFGDSREIKKKLGKSLFDFRNSSNVICGVVITLILIALGYLPISGVTAAFRDFDPTVKSSPLFFVHNWSILNYILFFIPIGYFLPIILNKVFRFLQLSLIISAIGIFSGVCLSIIVTNNLTAGFLFIYFASSFIGGITGYIVLIAVNKLNMASKNKRMTRT